MALRAEGNGQLREVVEAAREVVSAASTTPATPPASAPTAPAVEVAQGESGAAVDAATSKSSPPSTARPSLLRPFNFSLSALLSRLLPQQSPAFHRSGLAMQPPTCRGDEETLETGGTEGVDPRPTAAALEGASNGTQLGQPTTSLPANDSRPTGTPVDLVAEALSTLPFPSTSPSSLPASKRVNPLHELKDTVFKRLQEKKLEKEKKRESLQEEASASAQDAAGGTAAAPPQTASPSPVTSPSPAASDDALKAAASVGEGSSSIIHPSPRASAPSDRFNYAAYDSGAKLLAASPNMKKASAILVSDDDRYLMVPCEERDKWLIVQLKEDILLEAVELANYEHYASSVRDFTLYGSSVYPTEAWTELGRFHAPLSHHAHYFALPMRDYAVRYLKMRWESQWKEEYYCTLTHLRVYGRSVLEAFREDLDDSAEVLREVEQVLIQQTNKDTEDSAKKEEPAPDAAQTSETPASSPTPSAAAEEGGPAAQGGEQADAPHEAPHTADLWQLISAWRGEPTHTDSAPSSPVMDAPGGFLTLVDVLQPSSAVDPSPPPPSAVAPPSPMVAFAVASMRPPPLLNLSVPPPPWPSSGAPPPVPSPIPILVDRPPSEDATVVDSTGDAPPSLSAAEPTASPFDPPPPLVAADAESEPGPAKGPSADSADPPPSSPGASIPSPPPPPPPLSSPSPSPMPTTTRDLMYHQMARLSRRAGAQSQAEAEAAAVKIDPSYAARFAHFVQGKAAKSTEPPLAPDHPPSTTSFIPELDRGEAVDGVVRVQVAVTDAEGGPLKGADDAPGLRTSGPLPGHGHGIQPPSSAVTAMGANGGGVGGGGGGGGGSVAGHQSIFKTLTNRLKELEIHQALSTHFVSALSDQFTEDINALRTHNAAIAQLLATVHPTAATDAARDDKDPAPSPLDPKDRWQLEASLRASLLEQLSGEVGAEVQALREGQRQLQQRLVDGLHATAAGQALLQREVLALAAVWAASRLLAWLAPSLSLLAAVRGVGWAAVRLCVAGFSLAYRLSLFLLGAALWLVPSRSSSSSSPAPPVKAAQHRRSSSADGAAPHRRPSAPSAPRASATTKAHTAVASAASRPTAPPLSSSGGGDGGHRPLLGAAAARQRESPSSPPPPPSSPPSSSPAFSPASAAPVVLSSAAPPSPPSCPPPPSRLSPSPRSRSWSGGALWKPPAPGSSVLPSVSFPSSDERKEGGGASASAYSPAPPPLSRAAPAPPLPPRRFPAASPASLAVRPAVPLWAEGLPTKVLLSHPSYAHRNAFAALQSPESRRLKAVK